jgi:hypothetical protein
MMHAFAKLLFDLPQLYPHAFRDGLPPNGKLAVPVFAADVRESQKVERLRLAFPSFFPALFGKPPELDPARFIWMQLQPTLS